MYTSGFGERLLDLADTAEQHSRGRWQGCRDVADHEQRGRLVELNAKLGEHRQVEREDVSAANTMPGSATAVSSVMSSSRALTCVPRRERTRADIAASITVTVAAMSASCAE